MVNRFHFIIGDYLGAAKEVRWKNDVLTICTELVVVEAYAGCKNYSVPSNAKGCKAYSIISLKERGRKTMTILISAMGIIGALSL